jgi:hypothetical protein
MKYYNGIFTPEYVYNARYNRAKTYNYVIPSSVVKSYDSFIYFIVNGTRSDSAFATIYECMVFRYGRMSSEDNYGLSIFTTLDSTPSGEGELTLGGDNDLIIYTGSTTQKQQHYLAATLPTLSGSYNSNYYESNLTFSTTASEAGVIETTKHIGEDSSTEKKLVGITLYYDPLPTDGQVIVKYKKDEESTWTTIFTDGTNSAISHSACNIESTGAELPIYKEIQFRFELTGGAQITGYEFTFTETNNKPY